MSADKLFRRLTHALRFGKVNLVDDTDVVQRGQIDVGPQGPNGSLGIRDNTAVVHHFGFTSVAPEGSDAVLLAVLGDLGNALVVGTNSQAKRLKNLSPGDAALYDTRGAYVWLTSAGLVIDGAGLPMTIRNVGTLTIDGNLVVTGDVTAGGVSLEHHVHGGVTAGAGDTGPPT